MATIWIYFMIFFCFIINVNLISIFDGISNIRYFNGIKCDLSNLETLSIYQNITTRSKLECATKCSVGSNCRSFDFCVSNGYNLCRLRQEIVSCTNSGFSSNICVNYERAGFVDDSTTEVIGTTPITTITDAIITTVQETTSDAITTTVQETTPDAITTTVLETTSDAITTTVLETTSDAITTTVLETTSDAITTTVQETTSDAITTTVLETTSDAITTTVQETTSDAITTTVLETTSDAITTTILETTPDATTTSTTTEATTESNPCRNNGVYNSGPGTCTCQLGCYGTYCTTCYADCKEGKDDFQVGIKVSYLKPAGAAEAFQTLCNFDYGVTYIQYRKYGNVNFNRSWAEYNDGFGDLTGDFWLGNKNIYTILNSKSYAATFRLYYGGAWDFQTYASFVINDESENYVLSYDENFYYISIDGLSPFDSTKEAKGQTFSTYDNDPTGCARSTGSGWWFNSGCSKSNINGPFPVTWGSVTSVTTTAIGLQSL